MAYGVSVWNGAGKIEVGHDNPTVIIDNVTRQQGVRSYDPPIVNGFTVRFSDSLVKTYPQRSGVTRLTCATYYNPITQINQTPQAAGWIVMEVG